MLTTLKSFLYLSYLRAKAYVIESKRWRDVPKKEGFSVFYGHDKIPAIGEKASGGIIKCQDLQTIFPNTVSGANILYLVSSALPLFARDMAGFAKRKGVKLVVNQNGVAIPAYHGHNLEKINKPRRFLIHNADYVIYQSKYCKQSGDKYLGSRQGKYEILYNPVDINIFKPNKKDLSSGVPVLLLAGSHHHFYRVRIAVQVVSELLNRGEKVRLIISGRLIWKDDENICSQELFNLCEKCGIADHVQVIGPYSQAEAVSIFQNADLLLHTKYMDCCPRVVIEAMACGLPVVYSKSGGVPELVGENAGIGVSVPVNWEQIQMPDAKQMADAILTILSSYKKYSQTARERAVARFDVHPWLESHRNIFESLF